MTLRNAMLVLFGIVLGALGGGAVGIGLGIAWGEFISEASARDASGAVALFTMMPLGAIIGALAGAVTFAIIVYRDAEIRLEPPAEG